MGGGTWSPPISRKSHLEDKILQPDSHLTIGNFRPLSCISCGTDNLTETENPKQELWSRLKRITALREMLQTCTLNTGPDGTGTVRWSQNQKKAEQTTGQGEIGSVTHNRDIPRPQPSTGGERQSKGKQCMGRLLIHIRRPQQAAGGARPRKSFFRILIASIVWRPPVRMVVVFGSRSLQTHPRGPHERSCPKRGKCRLRGH